LAYEYLKYAEYHTDLKSVEIIEKSATKKVICQKPVQVSSKEEDKL
jgi:hypothetical protein